MSRVAVFTFVALGALSGKHLWPCLPVFLLRPMSASPQEPCVGHVHGSAFMTGGVAWGVLRCLASVLLSRVCPEGCGCLCVKRRALSASCPLSQHLGPGPAPSHQSCAVRLTSVWGSRGSSGLGVSFQICESVCRFYPKAFGNWVGVASTVPRAGPTDFSVKGRL